MQSKLGIVFQGTLRTDGRVLREVNSFSPHFDVIYVFASLVHEDDHLLVPSNVKIIPFKLNSNWINRNLFFGKQFLSVLSVIESAKLDILICIDYPTLKLGTLLKKKQQSLELVYDSHEIYIETINQFFPKRGWKGIYGIPLIKINKLIHLKLEKKYVQQVAKCITVCNSLSTYFNERWQKEVAVIRNCPSIKHSRYELDKEKYKYQLNLPTDKQLLVYQGDINPGRGLFQLMDVMKLLPDRFQLIVVGEGMLLPELKAYNVDNQINNVSFLGGKSYVELMQYLLAADLGISFIEPINASKRYSLPNKLFEYMAVGLPIVSNDLPEPRALFEQYNCGVTVDLHNLSAVRDKIVALLSDTALMAELSQNGVEAIQQRLNWEEEFNLYLKDHLHFYKVKPSAIAD